MAKNSKPDTLVIVESPSKAKTINKYLGKNYIISSSVGHIIDLPKSRLAIDVEHGFKPEYINYQGEGKDTE
jgi:DNA topoisomerase-1